MSDFSFKTKSQPRRNQLQAGAQRKTNRHQPGQQRRQHTLAYRAAKRAAMEDLLA